ncbi:MAG TPA: CYCXC family (seleno)protein [Thermoanaerobaculia bacterium]|jgi:Pyruvate/2-oxoacid:ferredoxin oxidoreductase delta subunit
MQARLLAAATILAVAATSAGAAGPKTPAKKAPPATNSCASCTERGAVLDPALFTDTRIYEAEVRPAYEVARKYPATLDRLHCFCECQESMIHRHKTLLTCFTSKHAAGCGICMNEAILAGELKDKGLADDQIENTVESVFRTDGHRPTVGPG